jgi:hypothetical protein
VAARHQAASPCHSQLAYTRKVGSIMDIFLFINYFEKDSELA